MAAHQCQPQDDSLPKVWYNSTLTYRDISVNTFDLEDKHWSAEE